MSCLNTDHIITSRYVTFINHRSFSFNTSCFLFLCSATIFNVTVDADLLELVDESLYLNSSMRYVCNESGTQLLLMLEIVEYIVVDTVLVILRYYTQILFFFVV